MHSSLQSERDFIKACNETTRYTTGKHQVMRTFADAVKLHFPVHRLCGDRNTDTIENPDVKNSGQNSASHINWRKFWCPCLGGFGCPDEPYAYRLRQASPYPVSYASASTIPEDDHLADLQATPSFWCKDYINSSLIHIDIAGAVGSCWQGVAVEVFSGERLPKRKQS